MDRILEKAAAEQFHSITKDLRGRTVSGNSAWNWVAKLLEFNQYFFFWGMTIIGNIWRRNFSGRIICWRGFIFLFFLNCIFGLSCYNQNFTQIFNWKNSVLLKMIKIPSHFLGKWVASDINKNWLAQDWRGRIFFELISYKSHASAN